MAISGGKDSAVLLTLLVELIGMRRDVRIVAGCVDEGIDGYRPPSMQCAIDLCETLGVEFISTSYENLDFHQMDEVVKRLPIISESSEGVSMMPCSYCGVFRRQGINALARQVGADVVALGHNLDDMAQNSPHEHDQWRYRPNVTTCSAYRCACGWLTSEDCTITMDS